MFRPVVHPSCPLANYRLKLGDVVERLTLNVFTAVIDVGSLVARQLLKQAEPNGLEEAFDSCLSDAFFTIAG